MITIGLNDAQALVHFGSVKFMIQNRIQNILSRGIRKDAVRISLSPALKNYLASLLDDNELKKLIIASPSDLKTIAAFYKGSNAEFVKERSHSNFVLRNIFINHAYDNALFDKLEFIKSINRDTCPYCNRNYIYYLTADKKIKPQIDHFYPKSRYPFLAMSFYNLIPSCQTCNGFGAKEEKDPLEEDLINPYLLTHSDFKFSYTIKSIDVINPLFNKGSISVRFVKSVKGHMNVFKLQDFYDQHSDHVLELIVKSKLKYSEYYRKYLQSYKGFKFSEEEIDRLILGNYSLESELHKRPFAKLYQDIGRELGLIQI